MSLPQQPASALPLGPGLYSDQRARSLGGEVTLADILRTMTTDQLVRQHAAKIAAGPKVPNTPLPPKDILTGQNT
jgi:hypothetical protein